MHTSGVACPEGPSRSDRENTERSREGTNTSFHESCHCFRALDGICSKQMITGATHQTLRTQELPLRIHNQREAIYTEENFQL